MIVLFDLDGTLLDTRSAIVRAFCEAVLEVEGHAINPDDEHIHELLRRRPNEYFSQHYPNRADALTSAYQRCYSSDGVQLFPGVAAMLEDLAKSCFLGIVSNKANVRIEKDLDHCGIEMTVFDVIVGAEDTPERKPHPAPILRALPAGGRCDGKVVYVGDGPHDVLAAKSAGVESAAVTWGNYPVSQLQAVSPRNIFSQVSDLHCALMNYRN